MTELWPGEERKERILIRQKFRFEVGNKRNIRIFNHSGNGRKKKRRLSTGMVGWVIPRFPGLRQEAGQA